MIDMRKAASLVSLKVNGCKPTRVCDYDSTYYLVEAPKLSGEPDFSDPFYLVSKDGSEVLFYNPIFDLEKFSKSSKKSIQIGGDKSK